MMIVTRLVNLVAWWAFGPAIGADVFGKDNLMPGGVSYFQVVDNTVTEVMQDWSMTCGGGVYWSRIKAETQGYKSAITNIQVMYLASQLNLVQGSTSVDLQVRVYDWLKSSGLITKDWQLYDGVNTEDQCSINGLMTSYKVGLLFGSLGLMYKVSGRQEFLNDADSLLRKSFERYLVDGFITDPCEAGDLCQKNQVSPKGIASGLTPGIYCYGIQTLYETTTNSNTKKLIEDTLVKSVNGMLKSCDSEW